MSHLRLLIALPLLACTAFATDPAKRVLLVTHAGGFMHDTALIAEKVLKESGPKHGFQVTCYRFTADPDARFQAHLVGKLNWALGQAEGDATPSSRLARQ